MCNMILLCTCECSCSTVVLKWGREFYPGKFFGTTEVLRVHRSELVGDVAVPVSVRQVVLVCDLRSPRLNWRRSSSKG